MHFSPQNFLSQPSNSIFIQNLTLGTLGPKNISQNHPKSTCQTLFFFSPPLSLSHIHFPFRPPLSWPTATSMLWSSSSPRHRRSDERRAASSHSYPPSSAASVSDLCTCPALAPPWPSPRRPEVRRRPDPAGSGLRHPDPVTPAVVFVQIRRPSPWKISIANVVVKIGSSQPPFQLPLPGRRRRLPSRPRRLLVPSLPPLTTTPELRCVCGPELEPLRLAEATLTTLQATASPTLFTLGSTLT